MQKFIDNVVQLFRFDVLADLARVDFWAMATAYGLPIDDQTRRIVRNLHLLAERCHPDHCRYVAGPIRRRWVALKTLHGIVGTH